VHQGGAAPRLAREPGWLIGVAVAALVLGRLIPGGYGMVDPVGQTVGYLLFGIAFAALVLATQVADTGRGPWWIRGLRLAPLRSLGRYSYAMYLFHVPIDSMVVVPTLRNMGHELPLPLPEALAVAAVTGLLTWAAAWLSYHLFEKWFLGLKGRVAPRWRPTAVQPVAAGGSRLAP
jgi:peptidoglycan/LPS O-acetylase OafA/YrhL